MAILVATARGEAIVAINQRWRAPGAGKYIVHTHRYRLTAASGLQVENTFAVDRKLPELPRIGVSLVLPPELEQLEWLGRGPWENYSDRNRSAKFDVTPPSTISSPVIEAPW